MRFKDYAASVFLALRNLLGILLPSFALNKRIPCRKENKLYFYMHAYHG
jgi:hypothetical protein